MHSLWSAKLPLAEVRKKRKKAWGERGKKRQRVATETWKIKMKRKLDTIRNTRNATPSTSPTSSAI